MSCRKTEFGKTKNGKNTYLYTFVNSSGMQMKISDYGAILVSVIVKDREGKELDVVLGYDSARDYEEDGLYLGYIVGRCANRISGASFELNGTTYELCRNDNGKNNHHSGPDFYGKRIWNVEEVTENAITLSLFSPHMDQGYPGNVTVYTTYTLTEDNEIQIEYKAEPDEDTLINLTNHSYFNLNGHDAGTVLDHKVWINADMYAEPNEEFLPTGRMSDVKGTAMDFSVAKELGRDIEADCEAIRYVHGYDTSYLLKGEGYRKAATLESEKSGIKMTAYTEYPGLHLYTANFLNGEKGKCGAVYPRRGSVCFELQYFPDAIHHDNFEGPVCRKGETFYKKNAYRFEV